MPKGMVSPELLVQNEIISDYKRLILDFLLACNKKFRVRPPLRLYDSVHDGGKLDRQSPDKHVVID